MKNIAIMQPYFLPYIGYFQLINAVDEFIIYDNIQYTKRGWINRNRILQGNVEKYITLPLKKDSDFLDVRERYLSDTFDAGKLLRQIETAYHRAPHYAETIELLRHIICYENRNLFEYIYHSVKELCGYLDIDTPIIISSHIPYDNTLKGQDKVIAICKARKCERYINAIGGMKLYHAGSFHRENMELYFIEAQLREYPQYNNEFIPALSILDVMMFNSKDEVKKMLLEYRLLEGEN